MRKKCAVLLITIISLFLLGCRNTDQESEIWNAVINNDQSLLRELSEKNVDFNIRDDYGNTPLHKAVQSGELEMVLLLLELDADSSIKNLDDETPAELAESIGYSDMAEILRAADDTEDPLDLVSSEIDIWTAAKRGDITTLSNLLANGDYSINEEDEYDRATPLHWAAFAGNLDAVKYLVEEGAAIEYMARGGIQPIHWAAFEGHLNVVAFFLDELPYLRYSTDYKGKTPIHWAAHGGHVAILKFLVEEKDDRVNVFDWKGRTPLVYAVISGKIEAVEYLVSQDAKLRTRDEEWNTPLHHAAEGGYPDVVKYLIELEQRVSDTNTWGETALHLACKNSTDNTFGSFQVVKYLVEEGASINKDDSQDRSPLYWAAYSGNKRIVEYLVEQGAYIYNRTIDDVSIVDIAREREHYDIVNYILEKQAEDE